MCDERGVRVERLRWQARIDGTVTHARCPSERTERGYTLVCPRPHAHAHPCVHRCALASTQIRCCGHLMAIQSKRLCVLVKGEEGGGVRCTRVRACERTQERHGEH